MARVCKVTVLVDSAFTLQGYNPKAGDIVCYLIQDDECLVRVNRWVHMFSRFNDFRYVYDEHGEQSIIACWNTVPAYFAHRQAKSSGVVYERLPDVDGHAMEVAQQFRPMFDHLPRD